MPSLAYPLSLRFKVVALAPRIFVTDANGQEQMYIHQKAFKFKEDILIYNNSDKDNVIFRIRADRVIDFSARYMFYQGDQEENAFGSVKKKGMRSLWRSTYFTDNVNGVTTHHLKEDSPWVKVWDSLLGEIPFFGLVSSYFFHPSYTIYRGDNRDDESHPVMRLKKEPALFEGRFNLELLDESISQEEEILAVLSMIMLVQLERARG